ncbi:MAG: hypothetical protein Q8K82_00215 [Gemmatimonadaceae bacterium]|nr:hypothetical protein [Gemmatimonadaceae bacterium]
MTTRVTTTGAMWRRTLRQRASRLVAATILSSASRTPALAQQPSAAPNASATRPPASTASMGVLSRGVVVQPESVTVGDPFRVVVRVRAPRGAVVEFPIAPDSGTGVEALDPVVVVPSADSTATEQTATYRLAAWDVGRLPIRFPDVLVTEGDVVRRLSLGRNLVVEVVTVLPADSSERVPRPPRALFEFGPPWWWWVIVAAVALALVGLLWWWWRRREGPPPVVRTAYEMAQDEFARIESLELIASGERGHFVALVTDVARSYLARVMPIATPSLTTIELVHALRGEARVPLSRLTRVMHEADLVKFAGAAIDAEHALAIGIESRAIVDAVDTALQPETTQEAA